MPKKLLWLPLFALCLFSNHAQVRPLPSDTLSSKLERLRQRFRADSGDPGSPAAPVQRLQASLVKARQLLAAAERRARRGESAESALSELKSHHGELRAAAAESERLFAEIDARLVRAGLTGKLATWREFASGHRRRMEEISVYASRADAASAEALSAALAPLAETDENPRVFQIRSEIPRETAIPPLAEIPSRTDSRRAAETEPGPEDLAAGGFVQLTDEIRARAAALGNSPARIWAHARNDLEFEPYYGFMQGSAGVYWSGRGSSYDVSAYLVALLRAAGVPARFMSGRVEATCEDVANWMGTSTCEAAAKILPLITYVESSGATIAFDHVWVEVWLDTGEGPRWISLDPTYKPRDIRFGPPAPAIEFDKLKYLAGSPISLLSTSAYFDQLRQALQRSMPGTSLSDLQAAGRIRTDPIGQLPSSYPWKLKGYYWRVPAPDPKLGHRIEIDIQDSATQRSLVKAELKVAEMLLEPVAVAFAPATATDQKTIQAFGGLSKTPAALVSLAPRILVGGKVVAAADAGVETGKYVTINLSYFLPRGTERSGSGVHSVRAGELLNIALGTPHATQRYIGWRIDSYLSSSALGSGASDAALRELLHIAGLRYLQRYVNETQRVAGVNQIRVLTRQPMEAATQSTLDVQNLFDRPFLLTPGRLTLDAVFIPISFSSLHSASAETIRLSRDVLAPTSSSLEHELWEELVLIPSISTSKVLQVAYQGKVPIKTLTKANAAAEMPQLVHADSIKKVIQTELDSGRRVIVPAQPVTYLKWRGVGFIAEDDVGYFRYAIAQYSGGDTGGNTPEKRDPASEPGVQGSGVDQASCGQPVTLSNGNMFHQFEDLVAAGRGFPVRLTRTYNSQSTRSGPLGYGWTHTYLTSLRDDQTSVLYIDGEGGSYVFAAQTGSYLSPPGLNLTLVKDTQGFLLRTRDGTQSRFDTGGKLQTVTDRSGNQQRLTYDTRGNLDSMRDPGGAYLAFRYDSQNRITDVDDHTQRRVRYAYDSRGDLVSSTDADGNQTTYTYDTTRQASHNLRNITDPEGHTITFEYYANDKVSRVLNPGGGEMRFYYLPMRGETVVLDERGLATAYQYDALGRITRVIRPDGNQIDQAWAGDGKLISQTDEGGLTTSFTYDQRGDLTRIAYASGKTREFTYEPVFGGLAGIRDPNGNLTRLEYDSRGNVTRTVDPLGAETKFTWGSSGELLSVSDAEGRQVGFTYDNQGNPTERRDAAGGTTRIEFDRLGRPTAVRDPAGQRQQIEYGALGQVLRWVNALGQATSLTYDRDGNLTAGTDRMGTLRQFAYDGNGNLSKVTDEAGGVTDYRRDTRGCACGETPNLTSVRDANGNVRALEYDLRDRVASYADAKGRAARYEYDARGNPIAFTGRNGETVRQEYDARSRLVKRVLPDGAEETFAYDANGNLLRAANAATTLTFTYDARDRVTSVADSRVGRPVRYTYDRTGLRQTMTDPDGGVTTYSHNNIGRLESITAPDGKVTRFRYDAAGRRIQMSLATGVQTAYTYDAAGNLTALVHTDAAGQTLAGWSYGYDAGGRLVKVTDPAGEHSYRYDELSRLVAASHPDGAVESYSYDAAGNRLSAGETAYSYDEEHRLQSAGEVSFTYDDSGRTTSRTGAEGTTGYTHDAVGRLLRVDLAGGASVEYKYDALNRRIEKSANGVVTRYLYDGPNLLGEFDAAGSLAARYLFGPGVDEPLVVTRDGQSRYLLTGTLGSVALVTDAAGAVESSLSYDSFGRPLAWPATAPAAFSYTGREFDAETGLLYYRARYYDPRIGRFLTPDPLDLYAVVESPAPEPGLAAPEALHPYAYVGNNPLGYVDPSGLVKKKPKLDMENFFPPAMKRAYQLDLANQERTVRCNMPALRQIRGALTEATYLALAASSVVNLRPVTNSDRYWAFGAAAVALDALRYIGDMSWSKDPITGDPTGSLFQTHVYAPWRVPDNWTGTTVR